MRIGAEKLVGLAVVAVFIAVVLYFFVFSETQITGEMLEVYNWAKTPEGWALLEQVPCYCGCKFDGHKHTRHCFWKDDGTLDKHGVTCATCFDIGKTTRQMHEQNKTICEIRKAVDDFYKPNAELATPTPMPAGCA